MRGHWEHFLIQRGSKPITSDGCRQRLFPDLWFLKQSHGGGGRADTGAAFPFLFREAGTGAHSSEEQDGDTLSGFGPGGWGSAF